MSFVLLSVGLLAVIGAISTLRDEETKEKSKIICILVIIVGMIIAGIGIKLTVDEGIEDSKRTKWSDLTPQEQENAKWAYETKQYIDSLD